MEIGIFAKTFQRPHLEEVVRAISAHGLKCCQFNFSCAGLPTLPAVVELPLLAKIAQALKESGVRMAAISGTFNMIDPNRERRAEGLRRLVDLIKLCGPLGTRIVTLCSGTRHTQDMWREHSDNGNTEAWRDLIGSLEAVLPVAETAGVTLAVEPERANVVNSAAKAQQLLAELKSSALGILLDAANLLGPECIDRQEEVLSEAMERVAGRVVLAHAKDLDAGGKVRPVGEGTINWQGYLTLLGRAGFDGALIIHGVEEREVAGAVQCLRKAMREPVPPGLTRAQ